MALFWLGLLRAGIAWHHLPEINGPGSPFPSFKGGSFCCSTWLAASHFCEGSTARPVDMLGWGFPRIGEEHSSHFWWSAPSLSVCEWMCNVGLMRLVSLTKFDHNTTVTIVRLWTQSCMLNLPYSGKKGKTQLQQRLSKTQLSGSHNSL